MTSKYLFFAILEDETSPIIMMMRLHGQNSYPIKPVQVDVDISQKKIRSLLSHCNCLSIQVYSKPYKGKASLNPPTSHINLLLIYFNTQ